MNEPRFKHRHIILSNTSTTEKFTNPQGGGDSKFKITMRNRGEHRNFLIGTLDKIGREFKRLQHQRKAAGIDENGLTLTFRSEPGFELKTERLEYKKSGIELLSVHERDKSMSASVYVPGGNLNHFKKKIDRYGFENTLTGKPKNQPLVANISEIEVTVLMDLWADDDDIFPKPGKNTWWEVWLREGEPDENIEEKFRYFATITGLNLKEEIISFPERIVLLAYGTVKQMSKSLELLSCISEVRKAKESPEFFLKLPLNEQREWVEDALGRIDTSGSDRVAICILDTGINREHPLIKPFLTETDMHAYKINWLKSDQKGHGTQMAGLVIYGDLTEFLSINNPVNFPYHLESVKILSPHEDNEPQLFGAITSQGISRAEIEAPEKKRIVSMAVTTSDNRDRGRPSSWSAAIDNICSGAEDDTRRLMIISAGNTDLVNRHEYPENNITEGIHDPGQSWNAVCVGAFTEKTTIDRNEYPGWKLIAPPGDLSPSSTTSLIWDKQWPIKPDIVFEGGNNAIEPSSGEADNGPDNLQLLTTHNRPYEKLFAVSGDTSAAAAQVARIAAIIQAEYPELWPETIRALLIHSSEWTQAMKKHWGNLRIKKNVSNLVRYCGFGVPNLTRALRSANNALTLIVQDRLYPFEQKDNRCKTRDMHIHQIPWPVDILKELGGADVEMWVTLSYFIEPNPARRGQSNRYSYASHQLRFDVKTPEETIEQFKKRINKAIWEEGEKAETKSDSAKWLLGSQLRHSGSIHSDRWNGSAIELAQRNHIGVYPASGWWRENRKLKRWNHEARYSLVVSIDTPETDVDIYTAVANQIGITIEV